MTDKMDKMAEHLGANHVNYIVWRYVYSCRPQGGSYTAEFW